MNKERWERLSLAEQMGNIGSEISRARHWEKHRDREGCKKSLERALDLMDLTLQDARWRPRLKELARFREVVCHWYAGQKEYEIHPEGLETYCTSFALLARA